MLYVFAAVNPALLLLTPFSGATTYDSEEEKVCFTPPTTNQETGVLSFKASWVGLFFPSFPLPYVRRTSMHMNEMAC